jgi:hypothetical protein
VVHGQRATEDDLTVVVHQFWHVGSPLLAGSTAAAMCGDQSSQSRQQNRLGA